MHQFHTSLSKAVHFVSSLVIECLDYNAYVRHFVTSIEIGPDFHVINLFCRVRCLLSESSSAIIELVEQPAWVCAFGKDIVSIENDLRGDLRAGWCEVGKT